MCKGGLSRGADVKDVPSLRDSAAVGALVSGLTPRATHCDGPPALARSQETGLRGARGTCRVIVVGPLEDSLDPPHRDSGHDAQGYSMTSTPVPSMLLCFMSSRARLASLRA
jgi:hypothetical protein